MSFGSTTLHANPGQGNSIWLCVKPHLAFTAAKVISYKAHADQIVFVLGLLEEAAADASGTQQTAILPRQQQDQDVAVDGLWASEYVVSWEPADLKISMLGSV